LSKAASVKSPCFVFLIKSTSLVKGLEILSEIMNDRSTDKIILMQAKINMKVPIALPAEFRKEYGVRVIT